MKIFMAIFLPFLIGASNCAVTVEERPNHRLMEKRFIVAENAEVQKFVPEDHWDEVLEILERNKVNNNEVFQKKISNKLKTYSLKKGSVFTVQTVIFSTPSVGDYFRFILKNEDPKSKIKHLNVGEFARCGSHHTDNCLGVNHTFLRMKK
ncbi:MAG: hypothetical protein HRU19_01905 [Pseudobacteriovorax sp.]|nr:hypothetical protein [Pseudobacteriovorax sp.]